MKKNETQPLSPYRTFLRMVYRMRKAQKLYFEIKNPRSLHDAKLLEKDVDRWLSAAGVEGQKIEQMRLDSEKPN